MSDSIRKFVDAVNEGDADAARAVLTAHDDVRDKIDEPKFPFDTPAIVHSRNNRPMVAMDFDAYARLLHSALAEYWDHRRCSDVLR